MADPSRAVAGNAAGEFFVDTTCINCDACRCLAPAVFVEAGETSKVSRQPATPEERGAAMRALVACPTGSIGTVPKSSAKAAMMEFPHPFVDEISIVGFNSEDSFGATSWFIRRPDGNWLIDAPRWTPHLVRAFRAAGGISRTFLTHRDDVADCAKYAAEFRARRIIHRDDRSAQPDAEIVLEGLEPVTLAPDFVAIPVPGHTRGSTVLLYRGKYLFSGDHLEWDRDRRELHAFRSAVWYSWKVQTESMERLARFSFEWVLPGHGQWARLDPAAMGTEMDALVGRMRHA